MTDLEKQKVAVLRSQGQSYGAIADALHVSVNSVKTFCRRSHLSGARVAESLPENDLTEGENRVITTVTETPVKAGASPLHPTCRVKLTFSENGDENAIPDVLGMLMNSRCRQR
jgi:hypothetical protein